MDLRETQKHWIQLGEDDPFWAVLTEPDKRGGRWDLQEFFDTGIAEIDGVLSELKTRGIEFTGGKALDFGCGVGRLCQALSRHFDEVHGVDISSSMLEHANRFNRFPDRCSYHLNEVSDLSLFPDGWFDFVYTVIVLQHMPARYQRNYIAEFFRLLKPGGLTVFQVITSRGWRRLPPDPLVTAYRKLKHGKDAYISMFGLRETDVASLLAKGGMEVLDLQRKQVDDGRWLALRYVARKH